MELQPKSVKDSRLLFGCIQVTSQEILRRVIEIAIASVLVLAAAFKAFALLKNSQAITETILQTRASRALLIEVELLIAAWLTVGGWSPVRFLCSLLFLAALSAIATYDVTHSYPSCGCFGSLKIPPIITLTFDILAIIALTVTRPRLNWSKFDKPPLRSLLIAGTFFVLASGLLWTEYAYFSPRQPTYNPPTSVTSEEIVILAPQTWINQPLPLFTDIDDSTALRGGRWLVLFYHYDCDSCIKAIAYYLAVNRSNDPLKPKIAFVAIPPVAPLDQSPLPTSASYLRLNLVNRYQWFGTTPIAIMLDNGIVRHAAEGDAAEKPDRTWWQQ
jgi:hypothetical protein